MDKPKMLIVEDGPSERAVLRMIFDREGWDVVTAGSVVEALARLDPPPDCALLDLMLPDAGGELLLAKIRAEGLATRVVLSTGVADPERLDDATEIGADGLLRKPFTREDLVKACAPRAGSSG